MNEATNDNCDDTTTLDFIIVGGGLSGLVVARNLNNKYIVTTGTDDNNTIKNNKRKLRWQLFEASSRLGGRLQNDDAGRKIDIGGAWIWPPHQPNIMESLVNSSTLGIETFLQPGDGYDSSATTRIVGGAVEFVDKIYQELLTKFIIDNDKSCNSIQMDCPVVAVRRNTNHSISVELDSGEIVRTNHVIFAVPPKILSSSVSFHPGLSNEKSDAMSKSQTWMAGVTKVALVYRGASPQFWPLILREGGGLISPRFRSPAFQVYDGSPFSSPSSENKISVLTFFTLATLSNRTNNDAMLAKDCAEQVCQSLSSDSILEKSEIKKFIRSYDEFYVKRWPQERYISNETDPTEISPHPQPIPDLARSEWDGTLLFAGTETDLNSPGVMEGAVGAAIRVTKELSERLSISTE
jgi:monoamine oxidase